MSRQVHSKNFPGNPFSSNLVCINMLGDVAMTLALEPLNIPPCFLKSFADLPTLNGTNSSSRINTSMNFLP